MPKLCIPDRAIALERALAELVNFATQEAFTAAADLLCEECGYTRMLEKGNFVKKTDDSSGLS